MTFHLVYSLVWLLIPPWLFVATTVALWIANSLNKPAAKGRWWAMPLYAALQGSWLLFSISVLCLLVIVYNNLILHGPAALRLVL